MKTKYSIVKDSIKSKILDGTYQPNQKISSESELMKEFKVSRHTVRLAIGDLVTKGWLYRKQGSGTFCADRLREDAAHYQRNQKNIAIITTYISDYIFPSIIRGAESFLSQQGYRVSLFSTDNNHDNERQILEQIMAEHFDGIIIEPTKSASANPNINYYLNLERSNIPYIMINAYYDELEPISLTMDDEKGSFMQTEHLIKLGHRDIAGFFKTDDIQGTRRMKGYLKAHRKHGIKINPNFLITYFTEEKNSKPKEELIKIMKLTAPDIPSSIVCYNDELAMVLLDVLRERNLAVPEGISLVGYDDSHLSTVSEVKLTTIIHPKSKMGRKAGEMILKLIKEKSNNRENKLKCNIESIVYEPKLIVRKSTKEI